MSSPNSALQYDKVMVDIKDYVFHYKIESPKAWAFARTSLLDSFGCAIESISKSSECRRMLGPVIPGTTVLDGFRLPGTSYQLDPMKGAFDFGTTIRYMDHNDTMGGADWGHPSDNLGAILAVADWQCRNNKRGLARQRSGPPLTIKTLLEAMIKAYEIQGCFLIKNAFNALGLDHVILVKLASTAVVSWLIGLTEQQTLAAISHVWMDGPALRIYRSGSNTIPRKGWAAGDACMRAVQLALLVRAGQPGAATVLTMPRWGFYETMWKGQLFDLPQPLGTWCIENIFYKVMAVEGHSISGIQAALVHYESLHSQGFTPKDMIERVNVRTNGAANMIINKTGTLHNAADRDHCMQYSLAVALMKGDVPLPEDYMDNSTFAKSQEVEELRSRIHISEDEQFTRDYLDLDKKSVPTAISIDLRDGGVMKEVVVEYPVGHGKNKSTAKQVGKKFFRNMALMFSAEESKFIISAVEREPEMAISDLVDLLVRPHVSLPKL